MNTFKAEVLNTLNMAARNPLSNIELIIIIALSIVGAILTLKKLGKLMEFPMDNPNRTIITASILVISALIIATLTNTFIVPKIASIMMKKIALVLSLLVAIVAVTAPAACFVQKVKYSKAVVSLVLTAGTTLIILLLTSGACKAVRSGGKEANKTKVNNKELEQILAK